jgi:hypothetical protein
MLSNERVDNEAIVTGSPHAGRLGQPQKGVVMNKRFPMLSSLPVALRNYRSRRY